MNLLNINHNTFQYHLIDTLLERLNIERLDNNLIERKKTEI